ncbi:ABC transporter permease [Dinghuibacter silviterrae]|uniref:Putative ABC transport system permease protein n=1 Tax=Dinghuibacter silviterrae TaxID=1539049 RepID=A0A4R8DPM0_9BACT|nr:ABC transporter permease [Dinghuibacter silviterrae]TDW99070.1 putative ABC transport system permease protein [Dinghuibacter silviterrae]
MIRSYLLIAWRNLAKQKVLSFINIFGLSIGVACFSLFLLYALNEFGFDSFHRNAKNIYRAYDDNAIYHKHLAGGSLFTPMPLGPAMKQDLSGVVDYTRFVQSFETFLHQGDVAKRENIAFADPSFFHIFSFHLKEGNPASALNGLHSLVVTEETAKRLFGNEDAMGKTIQMQVLGNAFEPFTVTGVAEDIPANSSISFNMLANFQVIETTAEGKGDIGNWDRSSFLTFVQLQPGSNLASDEKLLTAFRLKYLPYKGHAKPDFFALEPLTEMHTDTGFGFTARFLRIPPVDPSFIWILLGIASGVLLISCINFTTLSVGRSAHRAREVGVRKAIGGRVGNLRRQFLTEAFLMTLVAFVLGYALAFFLLPFFNDYTGRNLSFSFERYPVLPWMTIGLIGVVTVLSGGYPAWMLSRFRAVDVLKSKLRFGGANGFTKSLVTLQFVLSTGLIIGAMVMVQQVHFMQSKDPGFAKENVVVIEARNIPGINNIYARFKQGLTAYPSIAGTASADNGLGDREGIAIRGYDYEDKSFEYHPFFVDPDFVPVLGMQITAGRNLSGAFSADTVHSVLINEAMVKALGWTPATAIGRQLKSLQSGDTAAPPTVVGVVKDFHFQAMDQAIQPQLFHAFTGGMPYHFFVRIHPGDPSKALAAIQTEWDKAAPGYSLRYTFLDEDLDRYYIADVRLSHIIGWAGGISIFLACLGLLGLAMLSALNRTKEIGIRKVLGASLQVIVGLISRDFLRLVALAFLIATPLAWYVMHRWLEGYYYRIQLSWWVFALTGAGILGVAWITVALQAFKAARANPVKSLRVE